MREVTLKLARLRHLMEQKGLDGILLTKKNNFAWLTGGRDNHIETVAEKGACQLFITRENQYVLTNNIEAGRLLAEELQDLPFIPSIVPWYENTSDDFLKHGLIGADDNLPGLVNLTLPLARTRASLTIEEVERYRWLGRQTSTVLEKVCRDISPGEAEQEISGRLAAALISVGITPYVTLVAADERIFRYRHPIPTGNKIDKYVMVVVCAERWGLIANATRLVHFGELPGELAQKFSAALEVEASLITATIPGRSLAEIFAEGMKAYALQGYPEQWQHHHQGGPTGYNPRDYVATPDCPEVVQENQAFAWNPSITGVKTEDTILVTPEGFQWLTSPCDWPTRTVNYAGKSLQRPDILVK